ncbi:MAG TPA: thioesterase domain-containing protein, partial [Mycobacteriales bacterium]|nr:thioesterase domain-containing protein [Mycobacteriales bacterium]
ICFPPIVTPAGAEQLVRFAAPFRGERAVWALPHPGFGRDEPLPATLAVLLRRHAELALRCAADRPPVLVGYSSGGWVARAVAGQLAGLGRAPLAVVLLDAFSLGAADAAGVFDELMAAQAVRSGPAGALGEELTAMGWYLALVERTAAPEPPAGVTATVEVPGDHVSMLTDHAAATAAAVESWVAAEEDRCRAAGSTSSR